MSVFIHPTAVVSPQAQLGDGVSIGPFCYVDGAVSIGARTELKAFCRVCDYSTIGEDCQIFEHAVIGSVPQDHGFKGETSYVRIGNGTIIRESVTVHRASGEGAVTAVGDGCLIMEGVHLAHNVRLGNDVTISNKTGLAGYVTVGDGTVISGLAGFHQFVRIGRFCMVGGLSKNIQDIPPFTLVDGHPARIYGINVVGLRRHGFTSEQRLLIRRVYKSLYRSGLSLREAVAAAQQRFQGEALAEEILQFYSSDDGQRGICPWSLSAKGRSKNRDEEA